MGEALSALGVGLVVFIATNVDDLLLIAAFFADPSFAPRHVVAGQILGIAALVALSAACALFAVVVPEGWIGLLGLVPLGLGLRGLWALRRGEEDGDDDEAPPRPDMAHAKVLAVAGVTVANGGDNLGVYIPLFSSAPKLVPLYAALFVVMTGVFCAIGYHLVHNALLGRRIQRWGRLALPFVLVALGLLILSRALVLVRG
ncbi:cadmium resistance transporter [Polyangium aurulentum]|uniref:cadmium resistance transporter n=1 Tax=Polyangium aurulentum TaxID=2567896 RepID=UPI0010AEDD3C|nr:cadmium resistance transporter [Polyangium aurulentum]UQA56834.1 cadmium resistance transporter [Polyangium aurulentum]